MENGENSQTLLILEIQIFLQTLKHASLLQLL